MMKKNIKVKQRDLTDCGAACLASVSAYYQLEMPVSRIRQMACTDQSGTNALGMVEAAEKLGFAAKAVKAVDAEGKPNFESLRKVPKPAIAHIVGKNKLRHFVVVCAMTQGSVHRILNVKECSYVIAGQQIMEISPDGKLLAECYVASKDIGLVRIGLPVRLRVDAFDYTQWGILSGKVQEIAKDLTVSEQGSYYKVLCSLDNETLSLKNGFTGVVKKGMTINARIVVNRRTIFQQLYDKIDDWINPTVY